MTSSCFRACNAPVPLSWFLSANQYELAFVAHRTAPYWFELLRISSLPLSYWFAGQYECFEMFKTFVLALWIEAYSYCVVFHRRTSYQFVSVPIGSYLIVVHSYRFIVHSHWDSPPVWCDSVRCNTMRNDRIVVLDRRIGSCRFLLVPIVFSPHHSAIVLILHHHRTASYCIVSPSCCILLRITASYQFVFNSCLIRIDSQIIIVSNRSGSA